MITSYWEQVDCAVDLAILDRKTSQVLSGERQAYYNAHNKSLCMTLLPLPDSPYYGLVKLSTYHVVRLFADDATNRLAYQSLRTMKWGSHWIAEDQSFKVNKHMAASIKCSDKCMTAEGKIARWHFTQTKARPHAEYAKFALRLQDGARRGRHPKLMWIVGDNADAEEDAHAQYYPDLVCSSDIRQTNNYKHQFKYGVIIITESNVSQITGALEAVLRSATELKEANGGDIVIALDVEWLAGVVAAPPALIQLGTSEIAVLVRTCEDGVGMPASLKNLLENDDVIKIGICMGNDKKKILEAFQTTVANPLDLAAHARTMISGKRHWGAVSLFMEFGKNGSKTTFAGKGSNGVQ